MNLTVTDVVAVLTAIVLIYKAVTLTPVDRSLSEATAMEKMDALVTRAVERGLKLENRIDALEAEAGTLSAQVKERDKTIDTLVREMAEIKEWAERLVHQVKALGGEPVAIKKGKGA